MRQLRRVGWVLSAAAFGWLSGASALAAAPERLKLATSSACPDQTEIARHLARVLPDTALLLDDAARGATAHAAVFDDGASFRVDVEGQHRNFEDTARDCAERARLAAVFIGLILDPPLAPEPPPDATPKDEPLPPPTRNPPPPSNRHLELGAALQLSPTAETLRTPVATGAQARVVWGRRLGVSLGASAALPTTLRFESADARVSWYGVDLGVRFVHEGNGYAVGGEIGPSALFLSATGQRVLNPQTDEHLEVGLRGALLGQYWPSESAGLFFEVSARAVIQPTTFQIRPNDSFGESPNLWVGAALGLATRL